MATEPPPSPVVPPSAPEVRTPLPPVAPPPGEPPRGFLATLAGIYFDPIATFRAIAARPAWIAPFVAVIVLNVAFTFVWTRKADPTEFMRAQMEERGVLDRVPVERQADILERQAKMFPVFAWLGPVLFGPLVFIGLAGLLLFVYRFFYASETTFRQSLAVVSWALFAVTLVSVPLTLLVLALKGEWSIDPRTAVQANLAAVVDKSAVAKPLYTLLEAIDLFTAWTLFLLAAGYAATTGKRVGAAAVGLLVLWGILVLGKVGLAAIF